MVDEFHLYDLETTFNLIIRPLSDPKKKNLIQKRAESVAELFAKAILFIKLSTRLLKEEHDKIQGVLILTDSLKLKFFLIPSNKEEIHSFLDDISKVIKMFPCDGRLPFQSAIVKIKFLDKHVSRFKDLNLVADR